MEGGLGELARRPSSASIASRAARSASSQRCRRRALLRLRAAPPSPPPARSGRRAAAPPPGGSARSSRRRGRRRSGRRRLAASQVRSGLLVGISPKRRTRSGATESREALVAQQQVVGGDDVGAVVGAAAQLRGRLGEDREARRAGQVGERLAQLGVELAAGDDHAGDRVADVAGDLVEQEGRGLEVDRRHRRQRPLAAPFQRERVGRGHRALDRERRQRLAPGQVEVDGAGARLAARRRQRPAGDRAVVQQPLVVGLVGADFAEPAHRVAVELELVDRLPGADPAQLGRPVGGEDDQRQRRLVRLADRRVVVGRRRARGAEDRHRRAASPGRRRARRRRPSARRRSRSPRSPAGARARPRAGSSASRGRAPRGARRRAPAPRRRPRRARCWRWSGPCRADYSPYTRKSRQAAQSRWAASAASSISTPSRGRRAGGACRPRSSHSTEAIVEAKRRWVARPWARSGSSAPAGLASASAATCAAAAIPTGPSSALEM